MAQGVLITCAVALVACVGFFAANALGGLAGGTGGVALGKPVLVGSSIALSGTALASPGSSSSGCECVAKHSACVED